MALLKIICYNCNQKLDVSEIPPFTKIECPVCQVPIIVPKPFGNLLLEELLGEGILTIVYRAMDVTLDREIAVKVLKKEFVLQDLSQAFINEARSASAINHPNIIPIYSCGEMEDQPYLIMQYMEGRNLKHRLKQGPISALYDILTWFADLASALDFATVQGVTHGNIKPSNIFFDMDNNVKIGDFSLNHILESHRPLLENNRLSPFVNLEMSYYLSPERISTGKYDTTGDIYSFGAVLYHAVTGVPPFNYPTPMENIRAHFENPPLPPIKIRPELNVELSQFIMTMVSIYPSERPRSFREIHQKLIDLRKNIKKEEKSGEISYTPPNLERKNPPIKRSTVESNARKEQVTRVKVSTNPSIQEDKKDLSDRYLLEKPFPSRVTSFIYSLLYWIPILIICLFLLIAVAHLANLPIYNRTLRPWVEKILSDPGSSPTQSPVQEVTPLDQPDQ